MNRVDGTCPDCGEPTVTYGSQTTHTITGRADRWQGTLAELLSCNPAVSPTETGD